MSRLKKKFIEEIKPQLIKKWPDRNVMQIPVLKKVVISMGLGDLSKDKNALSEHINELSLLSGQKPIVMKAKKAISNFKLRIGLPIGLKVTLRGTRMYDFFDRFCNLATPRIRDFRGFAAKGDGRGNLSIGLEDQQCFCEVNLDEVKRVQGMNICFVTSATNEEDMRELLILLGFPFK